MAIPASRPRTRTPALQLALKKAGCQKMFKDERTGATTKRLALLRCVKTLQDGDTPHCLETRPPILSGYSGEGKHRFRREAERPSAAKVNSIRSAATRTWLLWSKCSSSESQKRALEIAPGYPQKRTVDASGSLRWRVDLVGEDVFGKRFGDSQIEPS
jgi:hypothetical protein